MYPPLFVLKPVADNIWLADGPAVSYFGLPFPTRMTIIRLENGGIWLHAPVAFRPQLLAQVQQLGPIQHLVTPNWLHYAYLQEWQLACPDALVWLPPAVQQRALSRHLTQQADCELGFAPDSLAAAGWPAEVRFLLISAGAHQQNSSHQETVFFHQPSKTLILACLIENFELDKCPLWSRPLFWLAGNVDPDGKAPLDLRWRFRHHKGSLRSAVLQMLAWQPKRLILSHGRWYSGHVMAELLRAFRWVK